MAVGEHDERAVGETEPEVGVARLELGDGRVVLLFEAGDGEAASGEIDEERPARAVAEALAEQVVDLCCRLCGDDKRAGFVTQGGEDLLAAWLCGVGERDERTRVEQQGQAPNPSSSSCSGISETGRRSPSMRAKPSASAKLRS